MTVVIGIDVATAEVRAVAVTPHGTPLRAVSRPLPAPRHPYPGWTEQRPCYADAALDALGALLDDLGGSGVSGSGVSGSGIWGSGGSGSGVSGVSVAGLAVTATSGTVVPCDTRGVPVGPALLYDDRRADDDPALAAVARRAAALARVGWLARHRPAPRYLHASDVVVSALLDALGPTDTSHALKTGADPETARWPDELLDRAGVDADRLPRLARPGTLAGRVAAGPAGRTGLAAGTPVVLGMTDGCAGQVAAGAVTPGQAVGVLGTTLVLKAVAARRVSAPAGAVYSHRAPDGRWWPGGASNVGAGALADAFPYSDLRALDAAAARYGPATAIRYPLTRVGERFPFVSPDARGFWIGRPVDDVDTYRGLLEGVAYTERLGFAVLSRAGAPTGGGPDGQDGSDTRATVRAVGGGSRSEVWLRIRATVLNRPVVVPAQASSAFGAAVLAAAATVHDGLAGAVAAMVRPARTVEPATDERAALDDSYHRFVAALVERGYLPDPFPMNGPFVR